MESQDYEFSPAYASYPISLRSILILSTRLCLYLQNSFFPSGFKIKFWMSFLLRVGLNANYVIRQEQYEII
jgi:hypothetical protein